MHGETNAFDLRWHFFWEANGYYAIHRCAALLLPSPGKLEEC